MNILVTGGAGFIGSHTLIELMAAGHSVVVVDNLSNSNPESLHRVESITGQKVPFYKVDIRDRVGLARVFDQHSFDCCIHFAGLKAVEVSVVKPWEYYENNIGGTLAKGHVKALKAIENNCGVAIYNLGTGRGYSVLEVIHAFEKVSGVTIPYVIEERRPGDIAMCYSDPFKAKHELGWKAEYGIEDMCRDAWNWQKKNPNGYGAS